MDIEISRDLQHYKESFVMGLTAKQFIFSALSLGAGAGVVLGLYNKIGMTLSCYLATPIVVPIALTGFYNHNGLSFWQTCLLYTSDEKNQEIKDLYDNLKEKDNLIKKLQEEAAGREAQIKDLEAKLSDVKVQTVQGAEKSIEIERAGKKPVDVYKRQGMY